LSEDADQDTDTDVCDDPDTARPPGTDGACVSEHPLVDPVTDAFADRFPAASNASTASV
jgi:hypothetical protein